MSETPGRVLQKLRESKGYQRDTRRFAELTGWSVDVCRNLERGRTLFNNKVLADLVSAKWIAPGDAWWKRFEAALASAAEAVDPVPDGANRFVSKTRKSLFASDASLANPFLDAGRITDPARFFDRKDVLGDILEKLEHGASVSLVGPPEIGKSSVMSMICSIGPEKLGLPAVAFAFLSLEWVDSEGEFYDALCEVLRIDTCRGYQLTRRLVGKRFVLCLDEIEKMSWDGFTVRVRSHLRGLADGSDAPVKLVVASRSPLSSLFPDSPELDSPLANICRQVDLAPFSPDTARDFVAQRLGPTRVRFSEEEMNFLVSGSGGRPGNLQQAAAALFDRHLRSLYPEASSGPAGG